MFLTVLTMKLLSWNIRGLCNPKKDLVLRKMVCEQKLEMMGLVETKLHHLEEPRVASIWGFSNFDYLWSPATDIHSGGLILIWNKNFFVKSEYSCDKGGLL